MGLVFQSDETEVLETVNFSLREVVEGELGESATPPEAQRYFQRRCCLGNCSLLKGPGAARH